MNQKNSKKCCGRCKNIDPLIDASVWETCLNPDCPCHTPTPTECDCTGDLHRPDCNAYKNATPHPEQWEEQVRGSMRITALVGGKTKGLTGLEDSLIEYIATLIKEAEELGREQVYKALEEDEIAYCIAQNGLPYCKNCGLDVGELRHTIEGK